jgi:hypothetical protein
MKFKLSSPSRSRPLPHDDDDAIASSPIKKQRTTCGTPTSFPSLTEGIFRPRRSQGFDEATEELLKIKRGVVLQPILADPEDPLLEQDEEKYSLLAKVLDTDHYFSMFPSVVGNTTPESDGLSVSTREQPS